MEQAFECKFCNHKFHREQTLITHMCVKKRRHMDAGLAGSRFGFIAYQKFYTIAMAAKKPKTMDDFINSPYYIDFAKFGNHLALLKPVNMEQYIEFVIRNGVDLKDWTKDHVYDFYINDLVKKEPATAAADRTVTEIAAWCEKNKVPFNEFFKQITANEAAHLIKTGKISPWVLYLSETGGELMEKFTEDHNKMIGTIIDPGFWKRKFLKAEDDMEYIKEVMRHACL